LFHVEKFEIPLFWDDDEVMMTVGSIREQVMERMPIKEDLKIKLI
jgi:hypothetical protein